VDPNVDKLLVSIRRPISRVMYIPLDVLYDYLEDIVDQDFVIYRFWPHGSKNIEHLVPKSNYSMEQLVTQPILICHDQEPLNFQHYQLTNIQSASWFDHWPRDFKQWWLSRNLRSACEINIHDRCILTHSEHRSVDVELYQQHGFEPVYVWSHALLARDWYRYAMLDPRLTNSINPQFDFNVYSRAWTGTREYRLYFLSLISDIAYRCRTTFSVMDNGQHYSQYQFDQDKFNIHNLDLENFFGDSSVSSDSSASYSSDHYSNCAIDVVMETICDTLKVHLTEKTLRPIACGKPFMLVGPPGSLDCLRDYGFRTFDHLIDQTYDQETDTVQRLHKISAEMKRIARLPTHQKHDLYTELYAIAEYNRKHFFSLNFFNQVINEYLVNMQTAMTNVQQSRQGHEWRSYLDLYQQWPEFLTHHDAQPVLSMQPLVESILG